MQPYPRAPDLLWPGQLHGTGSLSARPLDTGFPTVVWCLCLGPCCGWVWFSSTPTVLAGVLGGCVWVRFVVSSLLCRLGIVVFMVGLGFRPAPNLSWLGIWDARGCVRALPAPRRFRFRCAVWACVPGSGFRLRPATPDVFPWEAWPRDAAADTHTQAGRRSTALTWASSCSCHVTKCFRILATLKQGNKSMYSNTSGYVRLGLRLD